MTGELDAPDINDPNFSKKILAKIHTKMETTKKKITVMHICGTHEYTIAKNGIRGLLPPNLRIISGPGCPVCVCPASDIDIAVELARRDDTILVTFGDMMRVPSSTESLLETKARGADIRVVYSPHDAVELASKNPDKEVVFFGIGFETTAPLIAYELASKPATNFSVVSAYKLVPPAMDILLTIPHLNIDSFILPGHVCAIIGSKPFERYAQHYRSPMIVSGFEVNDMLISLYRLITMIEREEFTAENSYTRVVIKGGNPHAQAFLEQVFDVEDSFWRGIGKIPGSGLKIKENLAQFDAVKKFGINVELNPKMPAGCSCSEVLIGKLSPDQCPLFLKSCTPQHPIGPCMVSHEGACKIASMFHGL